MSNVIWVASTHPLSMLYAYPKLPLGDTEITSIQMGFAYVMLIQHQRRDLADELIDNYELKWNPNQIANWLYKKCFVPTVEFICHTRIVFRNILLHQMQCEDSQFRNTFLEMLSKVPYPKEVSFIVCSSTDEMILSCGLKYSKSIIGKEYTGFHVYAELLKEIADVATTESEVICNDFSLMMEKTVLLQHSNQKSVLIVSDSQSKFFEKVVNGDVCAVSGGRYTHMTTALVNGGVKLSSYKWIIIHCGTNMGIKEPWNNRDLVEQRDRDFAELRGVLIEEARRRGDNSVLFSCAFDHPSVPGNAGHCRDIKRKLQSQPIHCLNWEAEGNPFCVLGKVQMQFFECDRFHLNHLGLRVLWMRWCEFFPCLRYFSYTITAKTNAIKKTAIAPPPRAPRDNYNNFRFSRKRKFH